MQQISKKLALATVLSLALSACGTVDRIKNIGKAPDLNPMEQMQLPARTSSLALVMPQQADTPTQANSLWRSGAKAFFRDHRAASVGDIITVIIDIADEAAVENKTFRARTTSEDSRFNSFLGIEGEIAKILPGGFNPSSIADFGSNSSTNGSGTVDRSETISMTIAAVVSQVLPNGNLVIQGRQEVRVNFEVRELYITGMIRPTDISRFNTIQHTQIAEARISYGGRGQLTEVQQARYGQQLYDILFPF
jgi:flagellar L-ring protein precursor FlgH